MTDNSSLLAQNARFAAQFSDGDMTALPKLGMIVLTCIDARVDPAHVLGLKLGDSVVLRNNGGRVTRAALEEITALAALVGKLTGTGQAGFHIVLMQHTQCGAQIFADPAFQAEVLNKTGVDVSESAITDQESDLSRDIDKLRDATALPEGISVSALLYDVKTGIAREIAKPRTLAELRAAA